VGLLNRLVTVDETCIHIHIYTRGKHFVSLSGFTRERNFCILLPLSKVTTDVKAKRNYCGMLFGCHSNPHFLLSSFQLCK
jgi:hypothetical protein